MQRKKSLRTRSRRSGHALLASLIIVMVMALVCTAYVQLSARKHRESQTTADTKRAFYIAEAGFSEAFMGLAIGKSGNVASDLVPASFGQGVFWVTAEEAGGGKLMLTSTGLFGTGRVALAMVVENDPQSVASLGLFGGQRLVVQHGALIDSYDSAQGSYEMQGPSQSARVGCNDDITVHGSTDSPTVIGGDVTPGPDKSVLRTPSVSISGSTAPIEETVGLPPIEPPDVACQQVIAYTNTQKPLQLAAGEYGLKSLTLGRGAAAMLSGPATVVVRSLRAESGASLTLDGSAGPVKLFVQEELVLPHGSTFQTASHTPESVALLVSAGGSGQASSGLPLIGGGSTQPHVNLRPSGKFHGTIYAPNAELSLPRTFEVFGAVTAKSVTLEPQSRLHYDAALGGSNAPDQGLPQMSCWRIVEVPRVALVRQRSDPLRALERAGIVPLLAWDAHFDIGEAPPSGNPNVTPYTGGLPNRSTTSEPTAPAAPVLPPAQAAMLARLDEVPAVSSSQLKSELLAASPLHESVLLRAIDRLPILQDSDLKAVLVQNAPLPPTVLDAVLARDTPLQSSSLRDVLNASSPLPSGLISQLLGALSGLLSPSDLLSVLANQ